MATHVEKGVPCSQVAQGRFDHVTFRGNDVIYSQLLAVAGLKDCSDTQAGDPQFTAASKELIVYASDKMVYLKTMVDSAEHRIAG